jgi:hypothetical protein
MIKSKTLISLGSAVVIISFLCSQSLYAAAADGFNTFETQEHYEKYANELTKKDWFKDFASELNLSSYDKKDLQGLRYYLRINRDIDLNKITTTESAANPDNVNRVIRLMPKANFDNMFGNAGTKCSYINFLRAVALLPGLFSNYDDFEKETGLERTEEMKKDPDLIAKKILAAIMANAVQETSDSGKGEIPTMESKIPGTFATIVELPENPAYNSKSMGPFASGGAWNFVAGSNIYGGRGVHQITYCMNYANISLFLYGDLRLVKYPNLIVSDNFLPWLTTLVYFVLPQSQYPSIAEIFDGQWKRHLNSLSVDQDWKNRYMKEFPTCVLLINGGIECGQVSTKNPDKIKNNTIIRGDAYYHFVGDHPITIDKKEKKLFSEKSPKYNEALTGKEVLQACHSISQNDPGATSSKGLHQGLNWYRKFFLNEQVEPQNYYSDYMVFAGENIKKLMEKPKP